MRPVAPLLALALLTTTLAGCLGLDEPIQGTMEPQPVEPSPESLSHIVHETLLRERLTVKSSADGTELRVDVYRPEGEGPFPTILVLSPYWSFGGDRKAGDRYAPVYEQDWPTWYIPYFAPRGYAVALGEMRGTRDSGGCWDFGGELDRQDGHDMVEHLANQSWSNGRIGMLGQSHVGMSQIATAVTAPEHLTTIVPIAAVSDWYRYLHKDGAPYVLNRATPPAYFAVHASPSVSNVTPAWVMRQAETGCPDNAVHLSQSVELDGDKDAYWQERDLIARAPNITASVFLVHGFLDENVKTDHFLDLWNALPAHIEKRMWLGQWYHQHPPFLEWRNELHAWFDQELMGRTNLVRAAPTVTVQPNTDGAYAATHWPPRGTVEVAWVPHQGTLAPASGGSSEASSVGQASFLTLPSDERDQDRGLPTARNALFRSEPLEEPLHIVGAPRITLEGTLDQPTGRWVAVLYEVDAQGQRDEITRAYLDARHRASLEMGEDVAPGEPVVYDLTFYPRDHVVRPGSRLLLELSGGETCETPAGTCEGTGIVPVERPVTHTVSTGPDGPTRLLLPTIDDPGAVRELTPLDDFLDEQPE